MELCVRLIVVFFVFIIGDINFVKFVDDNVVISIRYGLVQGVICCFLSINKFIKVVNKFFGILYVVLLVGELWFRFLQLVVVWKFVIYNVLYF